MSLYLSRLCLNPLFAPALKLAADPYELHRKLLDTVPCGAKPKPAIPNQPKTANLLFRVDATDKGPDVLVQTTVEPDWDALELARRALRCPPQTKAYSPKCTPGQRLAFRLLCQPMVRKSGQFGLKRNGKRRPGPRRACRDDEQRLEWLRKKAEAAGFAIETAGLTLVEWRNTKPLQATDGAISETHDEARRRAFGPGSTQRLGAVRFDGVLLVTNVDLFTNAIAHGIGSFKAFGFGLFSLARVEG
jgi:CRISPR-associated protein Cas6/Cse3/CasE subtype I-E